MNILPDLQKNNFYKGLKTRFLIILSVIISFGLLASSIMLIPGYLASNIELEDIISQTKSAKKEINKETQDILDLPKSINSKVRFIRSNSSYRPVFSVINMAVSKKISGISINSISSINAKDSEGVHLGGLTVSGVAKDRKSLLDFSKSLAEEKSFANINVPVNSLTKDVNLPFSINISFSK